MFVNFLLLIHYYNKIIYIQSIEEDDVLYSLSCSLYNLLRSGFRGPQDIRRALRQDGSHGVDKFGSCRAAHAHARSSTAVFPSRSAAISRRQSGTAAARNSSATALVKYTQSPGGGGVVKSACSSARNCCSSKSETAQSGSAEKSSGAARSSHRANFSIAQAFRMR